MNDVKNVHLHDFIDQLIEPDSPVLVLPPPAVPQPCAVCRRDLHGSFVSSCCGMTLCMEHYLPGDHTCAGGRS